MPPTDEFKTLQQQTRAERTIYFPYEFIDPVPPVRTTSVALIPYVPYEQARQTFFNSLNKKTVPVTQFDPTNSAMIPYEPRQTLLSALNNKKSAILNDIVFRQPSIETKEPDFSHFPSYFSESQSPGNMVLLLCLMFDIILIANRLTIASEKFNHLNKLYKTNSDSSHAEDFDEDASSQNNPPSSPK